MYRLKPGENINHGHPRDVEDEVIQELTPGLVEFAGMGVRIFEATLDQQASSESGDEAIPTDQARPPVAHQCQREQSKLVQ